MAEQKKLERLRAQYQREIKALKKVLQRKGKAMAEIVALLVLQKNVGLACRLQVISRLRKSMLRALIC